MSKKQISNRQINVSIQDGVGQQFEQTVTVDDNTLPSPKELAEYKVVDPHIVAYLIDAAIAEQTHRHMVDEEKVEIVKNAETRSFRMNWWGMFFAFLALLSLVGLSAFALYLDRPWFAGLLTFAAVISIVSLFVNAGIKK